MKKLILTGFIALVASNIYTCSECDNCPTKTRPSLSPKTTKTAHTAARKIGHANFQNTKEYLNHIQDIQQNLINMSPQEVAKEVAFYKSRVPDSKQTDGVLSYMVKNNINELLQSLAFENQDIDPKEIGKSLSFLQDFINRGPRVNQPRLQEVHLLLLLILEDELQKLVHSSSQSVHNRLLGQYSKVIKN